MSHSSSYPQRLLNHHPQPESSILSSSSASSSSSSASLTKSSSYSSTPTTTTSRSSLYSYDSYPYSSYYQYSSNHLHHNQNLSRHSFPLLHVFSRRWTKFKTAYFHRHCSPFMATSTPGRSISVNMPMDIRRKKISRQLKKEELEREVSVLQKMLKQEEQMHEILEHIDQGHDGSSITIPNFIPPKVKELVAELVMVDGEISRLENQISHIRVGLKQEQEITKQTKSKQWQVGNSTTLMSNRQLLQPPRPLNKISSTINSDPVIKNKDVGNHNEKMAFETKALHFINKAIKGDYNLSDFRVNDQKLGKSTVFVDHHHQKENHFHGEGKFQDRVIPRRSGMIKSPSPLRDPRHPSPKVRERINLDTSLDLPPKPLSNSMPLEENIQNWQPNKLSENILKCLNFIYVRLLRISRATELEKSGPISRSMHSSLSSRSFRAETPLNPKSNIMLHKDSRQQDPYGVFDTEESIPRDIGPYKNLVIFSSSSMDPKYISSSSSVPLLQKLRVLMNNLQKVDLRVLTYQQKLAFWINMFNACIMHGFLQYGVPNTPEKMLALMNKATLSIGSNTLNAQAIEHYILRSSSMKEVYQKNENDDKAAVVRKLYGLEVSDPNVTFALCYGTRSSPAVKIYTADGVIAELEKSKLEYLQASIVVTNSRKIAFPELLLRNMHDFAKDLDSLVEWVCHQLPTSGTLRKSMVDCFRSHNSGKVISTTVDKIPYDFEFQYLLAI